MTFNSQLLAPKAVISYCVIASRVLQSQKPRSLTLKVRSGAIGLYSVADIECFLME
ncbi:MAG: hypothetical protein ACRC62_33165 [Microcoleus sp.]